MGYLLEPVSPSIGEVLEPVDLVARCSMNLVEDTEAELTTGTLTNVEYAGGGLRLVTTELSGSRIEKYRLLGIVTGDWILSWTATHDTGTALTMKVALTDDDTPPAPEAYQTTTSNMKISVLPANLTDVTGKYLWVKMEFTATTLGTSSVLASAYLGALQYVPDGVEITFGIDVVNTMNSPARWETTALTVDSIATAEAVVIPTGRWYWQATVDTAQTWTTRLTMPLSALQDLYQYVEVTEDPPTPRLVSVSKTRVVVGDTLTLTGTGFGYSTTTDTENADHTLRSFGGTVTLDGTACTVVSWSWTSIVIEVPELATSGALVVSLTAPSPTRSSNPLGVQVVTRAQTEEIGLELLICDRANPQNVLCQLGGAYDKGFQVLLNGNGSGSFTLSELDDNAQYVVDQNHVLVRLDGVDVFRWVIESLKPPSNTESEERLVQASGRSALSLLDYAIVYPTSMNAPVTLKRDFTVPAGRVLRTLLLEAQGRGCLQGVTVNWTDTHDSLGVPFADVYPLSFDVGTTLLDVATRMSDTLGLLELEMLPDLTLNAYVPRPDNVVPDVVYVEGLNILAYESESSTRGLSNAALVEGPENTLVAVTDEASQATWGRRESYLQVRTTGTGLHEYGSQYLGLVSQRRWSVQCTVVPYVGLDGEVVKPLDTVQVGDWVGVRRSTLENVKVCGITVIEDSETGYLTYGFELNDILLTAELRLKQAIERLGLNTDMGDFDDPITDSQSDVGLEDEVDRVDEALTDLELEVGNTEDLSTYTQESTVAAINELADIVYGGVDGQVLSVDPESGDPAWRDVGDVLDLGGGDEGDVLTMGSEGPEWVAPSGGAGGSLTRGQVTAYDAETHTCTFQPDGGGSPWTNVAVAEHMGTPTLNVPCWVGGSSS